MTNLSLQVPGVIYQYQLLPDGRSRFPFASDAIADVYELPPTLKTQSSRQLSM